MTPFVERCEPASPYFARLVSRSGLILAGLTRGEAEQLRDDLTAQLLDHSGETPAERAYRRLHDGERTAMPPESLGGAA